MTNTWATFTLGFSNLTDKEREIIQEKFDQLEKELDEQGITVDANTSDSGEF